MGQEVLPLENNEFNMRFNAFWRLGDEPVSLCVNLYVNILASAGGALQNGPTPYATESWLRLSYWTGFHFHPYSIYYILQATEMLAEHRLTVAGRL